MRLFKFLSIRSIACASLVTLVGLSGTAASAGYQSGYSKSYGVVHTPYQPQDYGHRPAYYYKEITVYENREIPDIHWITKYDHCGKPYQVKIVNYRTIQVPVKQRVKVAY